MPFKTWGQPSTATYPSLEAYFGHSDCVFTGTIVQVNAPSSVTIRVERVFKGKVGRTVVLQDPNLGEHDYFADWGIHRTPLLWFTKSSEWSFVKLDHSSATENLQPALGVSRFFRWTTHC